MVDDTVRAELTRQIADNLAQTEVAKRFERLLADEQIRVAVPKPEVGEAARQPGLGLARVAEILMTGYAERPAIGERATEIVVDAAGRRTRRLLPEYRTVSYGDLWSRAGALAADWHHDDRNPLRAGDFLGILGFASGDFAAVELAAIRLGLVAVPLQSSGTVAQWHSILTETGARTLAVSLELLDTALDLLDTALDCVLDDTPVTSIVVFDFESRDDRQAEIFAAARDRAARSGVTVESFAAVTARGATRPEVPLYVPADEDELALLIYTSGSTGTPKGAMYPYRLVTAMWQGPTMIPAPVMNFCYMPLSHVAGRMVLTGTYARGGTAFFAASSDMSTLFEDIALVRPTEVFFVPRVCDMVFQRYQSDLQRRLAAGESADTADDAVKTALREQFLGGRLARVMVGSAPISAEMKQFMNEVLGQPVIDGYGSTEAGGGLLIDNEIRRPPVLDYRLADVPELGYFSTDKPYPRGELVVKSMLQIPGYFKRPEVTAEIFDADGYYRTGDIVAEIRPDHLVYVDRRNNVLKLSQGEFVTVATLEAAYATSPLISQIFVHGSSERAHLLAVIVPTAAALALDPAERSAAITASLQDIAKQAQLESYEIPRAFLLEDEPFTQDNGLLSGIGKLLRPKLKERYGERLEQLYTELARQQTEELAALRREAADLPVVDTVCRAARAILGGEEPEPDAHFTDLGGDSLSALSFSTLLRELFDVEVAVGVIVSAANSLAGIAAHIESERESGGTRPTVTTVHGDGSEIRAADLTLDKFLDPAVLAAAPALPHAAQPPRTVLLTGANGYLGRFLCLEWLRRLDDTDGTLVCVVRGRDADAARRRLDEVFDSGDPELLRTYRDLAARRLRVLPGDIGEPNFGLPQQDWEQLAADVDLIVHPAALVNHVLPYGQLFGPNVVGTAEVIRLALTTTRKPVTYLSTVAVAAQIDPAAFTEDGDIREISAVRAVDDSYANGYGNSKWAGEVLLREAHDLCGLPVAVFRSDMILAHSAFAGQLNLPDMFTRLLLSVLATGLAPKSFYTLDSHGRRRRAHYDGLPADFTAAAITTLGVAVSEGFETYDVLNPHDDGISLDEFVDWLLESGRPIDRIDDYGDWFTRFETALRTLPELQRSASVQPLLHAYRHPSPPIAGSVLPAKRFQDAVQQAGIGPDGDIPHLTRELIDKYVADLTLRGLL
ncbi:NAD-dependent epimerase/dehydratase family protein [Nocardia yunnanensis]|uniref:Carboxylic acid reductase n=1 Tax=Nocardia yunnanensis TaxID=2382165 RepID=A0A386ZPG1_9NOCA|nr:carboxylic acid reductase [Nocardia yunnanensis]AYF79551.1 NAD-dependent epimerase/dehydratase family protein [Nocardia yunnanensis]